MPAKEEFRMGPQPDGGVRWAVSPESLEGLPSQSIWNNRAVVADVNGLTVAAGIYALPPRETGLSKFWSAITRAKGQTPEVARMRIEPSVPMTDYRRGDHTRLSAMHPYTVLEDNTRYGVGLWIPRGLFGEWSEEQERPESEGKLSFLGGREIYKERQVPALLVRLDGTTPLAGTKLSSGTTQEALLGIPEPTDEGTGDISVVVTNRQITGRHRNPDKAEVDDLTFNVIGERGTDGNSAIVNSGLVQVVFALVTEDHVIERIPTPKMTNILPGLPDNLPRSFMYGENLRGAPKGIAGDTTLSTDSTLLGETNFTNTRSQKVSIRSIRDVTPVAELSLVLVGSGGSITAEMTEATMPQSPQS